MADMPRYRVLILGNSQGTSIGLDSGNNYPALLQQMLGDGVEVHRMLVSGWTLRDVAAVFDDNVLALAPNLVVLQIGIVEAAQRILSDKAKAFFGLLPGGIRITALLHRHRARVLRWRQALGLSTRLVPLDEFGLLLAQIVGTLTTRGIRHCLIRMPSFPDGGAAMHHPFVNQDIAEYNAVMDAYDCLAVEKAAGWNAQCIQPGTVHFTAAGHGIIANQLCQIVRAQMRDGGAMAAVAQ